MRDSDAEQVIGPCAHLSISQFLQVVFAQAKMVADFVEDGFADLLDEFFFSTTDLLDGFLEDVNEVGDGAGILDAALGAGAALVEAKQEAARGDAKAGKLGGGG